MNEFSIQPDRVAVSASNPRSLFALWQHRRPHTNLPLSFLDSIMGLLYIPGAGWRFQVCWGSTFTGVFLFSELLRTGKKSLLDILGNCD